MNLDETQKSRVAQWVGEGLQLGEIQKKLAEDLGIRLTYMEVRFLLDDLSLKPRDKEVPEAPQVAPATDTAEPGALEDHAGGVSVSVDQVTRPGALVSGKVTFSDGAQADWSLDQFGRLALAPKQQGYKPSQPDVMAFQTQLQNALAKLGM